VTIYLVVPLLAVIALIQSTIVPHLSIWGVFADLPLLVVVSWGLLAGPREGILWGFIAGFAVDLFSGAPFGAATLAMMTVGFLSGLGETAVFRAQLALPLLIAFLATLLYDLIFLLIVRMSGTTVAWVDSLFRLILPSAILNVVLTPVVFLLVRLLHTGLRRRQMEL
jgi:rod shape-determining protein MreD